MLTTNQKGTLAEAKVAAAALEHGVGVALPLDDERYDLVLDVRPRLLRVQCKWAARINDVVFARLYTSRRGPEGLINRRYGAGEFDAFALYCPDTERCYLLPADEFVRFRQAHLRLAPPLNNQRLGVRWASDYEFGATLSRLRGPIAQLGEHLAGSQKVVGSSPTGST
jgi:PD-(D/E)XK nuclease superfamily protein